MGTNEQGRISKKQVEHIADLARIELSEEEKQLFTEQLNAILDYFKVLDEADTKEVQPMQSVLELRNVWREDTPRPCLPVDEVHKNVPRKEKGYVKAPRIA